MSGAVETQSREALQAAFVELLATIRRQQARAPELGLSFAQFRGLIKLGIAGEMTAGELAKAAEITPASATGMLDVLERDGIVERRRSEVDRRQVVVTLTEKGNAIVERKLAWWSTLWAEALDGLTDEEVAVGARVVARVGRSLAAAYEDRAA